MASIPYVAKRLRALGLPQAQADLFSDPRNATVPTKRIQHPIGSPTLWGSSASPLTQWAERIPVRLPHKTSRWRLKIGNWQSVATAAPATWTGAYTISDIYFGDPSTTLSAIGRLTGAYAATPTKVLDGGDIPTDGNYWTSAWVTDPALQFGPDMKMFGFGLTSPGGGTGVALTTSHPGFRNSAAGANATINVAAGTNYFGNNLALDKYIEYEVDKDVTVGLFLGASGEQGYNNVAGQGGGYEPVFLHETPPGAWGMRVGALWMNGGIPGATQAPFLNKDYLGFARFDTTHTKPDFTVIDLAGNSIMNGATLLAVQTDFVNVVAQCRALGLTKIYLCTVPPVDFATPADDAKETVRNNFNAWVRGHPLNVTGIIDMDRFMRDPTNTRRQMPGFVDTDKVHQLPGGNQWWGANIGLR